MSEIDRSPGPSSAAPPSPQSAPSVADTMQQRADTQVAIARRQTRRRLRLVGAAISLAVGFLLYKTLSNSITYFKTVDQAIAARSSLGGSTFQLEGLVVAHSIAYPNRTTVDFLIAGSHHHQIQVTNYGEPPELFQADVPVVILGHFVGGGLRFSSDQILVKHSNSYIAAHPNRVRAPNGSVH